MHPSAAWSRSVPRSSRSRCSRNATIRAPPWRASVMPFHSKRRTVTTRVRGSATRSFCDAPLLSSSYSPVFHLDPASTHTSKPAATKSPRKRNDEMRRARGSRKSATARPASLSPSPAAVSRNGRWNMKVRGAPPPEGGSRWWSRRGAQDAACSVVGASARRRVGEAARRRGGEATVTLDRWCVCRILFFFEMKTPPSSSSR